MRLWPLPTVLLLLCVAALGLTFMPTLFLPKRWLDIKPGLERSTVHAVLGVPDANYSVKGFDGWHNPFGVGASVLIVHYDENLRLVVSTNIGNKWGIEYRNWVQEYKQRLKQVTPSQR